MKYRKCDYCDSEFVCWNWFVAPFWATWMRNISYNSSFPYFRWKFWHFFDRWHGECWHCGRIVTTFFEVKNGIPNDELRKRFVSLPEHSIREISSALWNIVNTTKHFLDTDHDRKVYENRRKSVLDMVNSLFDEQWILDHKSSQQA